MGILNRMQTLWVACLLLAIAGAAPAAERLPLWQVEGEHNVVYLLGSVHLLRAGDYPLPEEITESYRAADTVVMELDMDDLDLAVAAAETRRLGILPEGSSLATVLGEERHAEAQRLAAAAGVPLDNLSSMEPWLAAITVEQFMLATIGFESARGIEAWLVQHAAADGKEILGLETIEEQLAMLDGLPPEVQATLLIETLTEAVNIEEIMDELIADWRNGDVEALEASMLADIRRHPALYSTIVIDRNRAWVDALEAMLEDRDDFLVAVGTLHLIGDEGVPALLEAAGYRVRQLRRQD